MTTSRRRCPVHGDARHGAEAEELRAGVEACLREGDDDLAERLQRMLDRVDARDSLAHLENVERLEKERDEARALAARLSKEKEAAEYGQILLRQERERDQGERAAIQRACVDAHAKARAAEQERDQARAEIEWLRAELNHPRVDEFLGAVLAEAAHQRQRWGVDHDAGKTPEDWFWLVGYLAGKALRDDGPEKRKHRIIATAAALANWFLHLGGVDRRMRPGIAPPPGEDGGGA